MDVIAEPIPGKTGGQFDSSEWSKEAAAGKMTPQEFANRFKMGDEKAFQDIVSGDQMRIIEGIKRIPDPNAQEAVLHTVIEFHKLKPTKFLSKEKIDEIINGVKAREFFHTEAQKVKKETFTGNLAELKIKPESPLQKLIGRVKQAIPRPGLKK